MPWAIPNAHGAQTLGEGWPIGCVPIPDEMSRCLIAWESIGDLAGDPFRRWIGCYAEGHPNSSPMPEDDKTIEDPKSDGRYDRKVHGGDAVGMIAEKGASPAMVASIGGTYT